MGFSPPINRTTLNLDPKHNETCSSQAAKAFFGQTTNNFSALSRLKVKSANASVVFPAPGTEKVAPDGNDTSFRTFRVCSSVNYRTNPLDFNLSSNSFLLIGCANKAS